MRQSQPAAATSRGGGAGGSSKKEPPPALQVGADGRVRYKPQRHGRERATKGSATPPPLRRFSAGDRDEHSTPSPVPRDAAATPTPISATTRAISAIKAASPSPQRAGGSAARRPRAGDSDHHHHGSNGNGGLTELHVSSIQRLPFGALEHVVESASSPFRHAREVIVSTGRTMPASPGRASTSPTRLSAREVRPLGPSHGDFAKVAARNGPTAWTRMEENIEDQRRAARFRDIKTPEPPGASLADVGATGSPKGSIKRGWEVEAFLRGPDAAQRVDRDALERVAAVQGEYRHYLLRDMLAANDMSPVALARAARRKQGDGGADDDEDDNEALREIRARMREKLGTVVASSDAVLEAATDGDSGLLSPRRLYAARLKEQADVDAAASALRDIKAAEARERENERQRAEDAARYTSTAVYAAPDADEVARLRRIHELILLARTRTEHLGVDAATAAAAATARRAAAGSTASPASPTVDPDGSGSAELLGTDDDARLRRFVHHEHEMERLIDAYFTARRHHAEAIGSTSERSDRVRRAAWRPDFSRKAFDAARRRVAESPERRRDAGGVLELYRSVADETPEGAAKRAQDAQTPGRNPPASAGRAKLSFAP